MKKEMTGDASSFDDNWKKREEALLTHWTRVQPTTQIQLAFRNHWTLFQELERTTPGHNAGKRVLEVGCGRGSLSCYYADAGYDCELIDLSPKAIEIAQSIFERNQLRAGFKIGDANNLPYEEGRFDVVFSIGLLEHFEDISRPLAEQVRVLSKGGLFIGYVVPKYDHNIQEDYIWINDILKCYRQEQSGVEANIKSEVFRSDLGSPRYMPILHELGLTNVSSSGVYPLPMISHSIDFPFSLMPESAELVLTKRLMAMLDKRGKETGVHPWLCDEGYGQAFLVWGIKK